MLTRTKAIKTAQRRVSIVKFGDGYRLHTWEPERNWTRESHQMDRYGAISAAWEAKLALALELICVDPLEAGEYANSECGNQDPGNKADWRTLVYRYQH